MHLLNSLKVIGESRFVFFCEFQLLQQNILSIVIINSYRTATSCFGRTIDIEIIAT